MITVRAAITQACSAWGVLNNDRTLCDLANQEGGPWPNEDILAEAQTMLGEGLLINGPQGQWSLAPTV